MNQRSPGHGRERACRSVADIGVAFWWCAERKATGWTVSHGAQAVQVCTWEREGATLTGEAGRREKGAGGVSGQNGAGPDD